jgi:broad specificity phosphatase PhoE
LTTPERPDRTPDRARLQHGIEALFRLDEEDAGELLLARHAEPAGAPDLEADPVLSCEGLRQAEHLADRLSGLWIDAVHTAPERRCFQTAKVIADVLQRPLTVTEGLSDVPFDPAEARGGPEA